MINAIIMASGFSRRMGRNKLMLLYNGKPLIDNVIDHIEGSGLADFSGVRQRGSP